MTIQDILNHSHVENDIDAETVAAIQNTTALRKSYFSPNTLHWFL